MAKWSVVCVNEAGIIISRHRSQPRTAPPGGCVFVVFDSPRAVRIGSRVDTVWGFGSRVDAGRTEYGLGYMQGRGAA